MIRVTLCVELILDFVGLPHTVDVLVAKNQKFLLLRDLIERFDYFVKVIGGGSLLQLFFTSTETITPNSSVRGNTNKSRLDYEYVSKYLQKVETRLDNYVSLMETKSCGKMLLLQLRTILAKYTRISTCGKCT